MTPEFITKYFHDTEEYQNAFNETATDEQITQLEQQLGITLPNDYKEFLHYTNGFDGQIHDFVAIFYPVDQVYQNTLDTCSKFFPWAVNIGTNGNLEMFVIDKRSQPYQFGLLPYIADDKDFIPLGVNFEKFIGRLYDDTAFDIN